ncbi:MAG TPA: YncE family protein [Stellaceae bacterium]|jgi:DNA-binding beta-propeller fold protein YncE|nr:YncE family protein [Stellaceae bacterium]
MRLLRLAGCVFAAAAVAASGGMAHAQQLMIVGNDQKPQFDNGKVTMGEPGKDTLSVVDIAKPAAPRIVATIPLDNTIVGPPTNLAITPARDLALVADTMKGVPKDNAFAIAPDNRLFVIDLTANPPVLASTLTLGNAPTGLAISPDGKWALVCNRDDGTVSVLSINGRDVKIADTATIGAATDKISAVAISPDGKTALVVKAGSDKVAVLTIDNGKVAYDAKNDLPANNYPYNVAITPNGQLALIANTGGGGSSDGDADTVSVVDMTAKPIHIIDHVTVGDSPEGLAISPKGNIAVTVEARGSNRSKETWYYHPGGAISVLRIDGKKVTRAGEVTVGGLPEGAAFSADGSHIYVGNFMNSDLSVLQVMGAQVTDTGKRFKLPGQPASLRAGPQ